MHDLCWAQQVTISNLVHLGQPKPLLPPPPPPPPPPPEFWPKPSLVLRISKIKRAYCERPERIHARRVCSAAEILVTAELRVIEAAAKLMAAAQQPGENEAQHDEPRDGIASSNTDGAANSESSGDGTGAGVGAPAVRHAEPEQLQRLTVAVQALIHLCHKVQCDSPWFKRNRLSHGD